MALGETFNYGNVLQTIEGVKAARRQSAEDEIRQQYLRAQTAAVEQDTQRKATEFDQGQKLYNTQLVNAAAKEVAANPAAISRWQSELSKAIPQLANQDLTKIAPEELQRAASELAQSTDVALQSLLANNPQIAEVMKRHESMLAEIAARSDAEKQQAATNFGYDRALIRERGNQDRQTIMARDSVEATSVPKPKPRDIQSLRKEFRSLGPVKDYETALPLLVSARKAPDNGFGDLQLIYTAGKVLDPGSVVREGELALTIAAGSPLQRVIGQTRFTAEKGGRLTPEVRAQLLGMLNERVLAYRQGYDREYSQYAEYAQEQGISPDQVVGRHPANAFQKNNPQSPAAPSQQGGKKIKLPNGVEVEFID